MLTTDQITSNWDTLINIIETKFSEDRKKGLLELYEGMANRIATEPASGKVFFHSCFTGGYVHHVLNVIRLAEKVSNLWVDIGGEKTYTDEELFFVALNHDLGKIGDLEHSYYVQNSDDWKIKRGWLYDTNPYMDYMKVPHRSIFLLQHYGIQMTQREFIGILIHDGMFDEGNSSYISNFSPTYELDRFNYVIHFADMWATKLEYEEWKNSDDGKKFLASFGEDAKKQLPFASKKSQKKKLSKVMERDSDIGSVTTKDVDDLFGDIFKTMGDTINDDSNNSDS